MNGIWNIALIKSTTLCGVIPIRTLAYSLTYYALDFSLSPPKEYVKAYTVESPKVLHAIVVKYGGEPLRFLHSTLITL